MTGFSYLSISIRLMMWLLIIPHDGEEVCRLWPGDCSVGFALDGRFLNIMCDHFRYYAATPPPANLSTVFPCTARTCGAVTARVLGCSYRRPDDAGSSPCRQRPSRMTRWWLSPAVVGRAES
ncbi:hypothetical protein BM221_003282 [Beauveria bassiana]|uniref:Secreted protein n=1 Tax=Beauveria bassiana TaxID=176275 RepID=A0A2N6NU76_BEABA|nr:hypothetical protein BM221_003282 [Beauveria bassiana]